MSRTPTTGAPGARVLLAIVGALVAAALAGCRSVDQPRVFRPPASTLPPSPCGPPEVAPPTSPEVAFPLHIAPGQRYLVDAGEHPFPLHGDAPWSLIAQLHREDVVRYLDARGRQGFNTILVNLLEHKFSTKAPANIYGDAPFLTPGDYATPNDVYFDHAAWVIQQAADRGFVVLLTPSYMGINGSDEGWYKEMKANGPDKLRDYGRYVARRFARLPNIVWVQAGDFDPPEDDLVDAIAGGIAEVTPDALQTAHTSPNTTASARWGDHPWLDLDTLYPTTEAYWDSLRLSLTTSRPHFMIESVYENEHYATPQSLRGQAYFTYLSGGMGHIFGNNPIWHFDGPGLYKAPASWQDSLDSPGANSMSYVRALLDRFKWWRSRPDVDHTFLSDGILQGPDMAMASVTCDDSAAAIYVPTPRPISLHPLQGGTTKLRWYDPTSGELHDATVKQGDDASVLVVEPPGANDAGDKDWVLLADVVSS